MGVRPGQPAPKPMPLLLHICRFSRQKLLTAGTCKQMQPNRVQNLLRSSTGTWSDAVAFIQHGFLESPVILPYAQKRSCCVCLQENDFLSGQVFL